MNEIIQLNRRRFIKNVGLGAIAAWTVPGAFAEELTWTPRQTEGPFYPDHLPLDNGQRPAHCQRFDHLRPSAK
jgi:hypothetical protein